MRLIDPPMALRSITLPQPLVRWVYDVAGLTLTLEANTAIFPRDLVCGSRIWRHRLANGMQVTTGSEQLNCRPCFEENNSTICRRDEVRIDSEKTTERCQLQPVLVYSLALLMRFSSPNLLPCKETLR